MEILHFLVNDIFITSTHSSLTHCLYWPHRPQKINWPNRFRHNENNARFSCPFGRYTNYL